MRASLSQRQRANRSVASRSVKVAMESRTLRQEGDVVQTSRQRVGNASGSSMYVGNSRCSTDVEAKALVRGAEGPQGSPKRC